MFVWVGGLSRSGKLCLGGHPQVVPARLFFTKFMIGPIANLSDDFMVLCDFLGRARALKTMNSWNISPKHALAMNRHILVSHFGHLTSLVVWAKLILGRFRDAVLPDFSRFPAGSDDNLNAFFTDPRHGRYCGRYFPGA